MSEPVQEKWFSQTIWLGLVKPFGLVGFYVYEAHFECHDILMVNGKSPIKRMQLPDMTIAVDWDVKHQFKQTNKKFLSGHKVSALEIRLTKQVSFFLNICHYSEYHLYIDNCLLVTHLSKLCWR